MNDHSPTDVGIDLGTTFSVIAVKGKVTTREGRFPAKYLESCDVSVLPTPYGDYTFPSVYWCDATGSDERFGAAAKQLAMEGESPLMFSKRSIGTTEMLAVNGHRFTARQVAAKFLAYLKSCAEDVLNREVRRAVITHPAYFHENQIQETLQAATDAGFEMNGRKQMLMEPTAAALAYTLQDGRDPLRIMTYDLGGGTFDVTILERLHGVIAIKSFNGDHLLGGYNFDRELVQWVIGRLRSTGRKIPFNPGSPADQARYARLLVLAEGVKVRLSNQPHPQQPVPIRDPDCLVDDQGRPVQIMLEMNRTDYARIVQGHLSRAIECCGKALATAQLEAKQLNEILLVGGSTYGPWVVDSVKEAFGVAPKLFEPDLCVAVGAALLAADLPHVVESAGFQVLLEAPKTVVLPRLSLAGSVQSTRGEQVESVRLNLNVGGQPRGHVHPDADGKFLFSQVEVSPRGTTRLVLRLESSTGQTVLEHAFSVTCAPTLPVRSIDTVLPKGIGIKVAGGLKLVAEQGVNLPTPEYQLELRRLHSDSSLEIPVYQADEEVGIIRIDNIPAQAGAGSPIDLRLQVNELNELVGAAAVLTRNGSVAASCEVQIQFPPLRIPSMEELKSWQSDLEGRLQQQLALNSDDAETRTLLGGAGKKLLQRVKRISGEIQPDRHELYRACSELDRLVNPPVDEMDPPRVQFAKYVDACQLLVQQSKDLQIQAYASQLQKIKLEGDAAYRDKNHRLWAEANRNIVLLHERIDNADARGGQAAQHAEPDPAWVLKDIGNSIVERLEQELARARKALATLANFESRIEPRCDDVAQQIHAMRSAIEAVSDDEAPRTAQSLIRRAVGKEKMIRQSIGQLDVDTKPIQPY